VAFVDQDKVPLKLSDLRGRVVLVNFIFTRCPGTCPLLSAQMAKVQRRIVGSGPAVKLLSITVDPDFDTSEVLKEYSEKYGAKRATWSFVRAPLKEIESVLVDGFKVATTNPNEVSNLMDLTHSENFVLVDQLGQIRAYRTLNNSEQIDSIMKEIAIVANTNPELAPKAGKDVSTPGR
jgi:protein SCO1/2